MVIYIAMRSSQEDWERVIASHGERSKFWRTFALLEIPEGGPAAVIDRIKSINADRPAVLVVATNDTDASPIPDFSVKRGAYTDQATGALADVLELDWNDHPDSDLDIIQVAVILGMNFDSVLSLYVNICQGTAEPDESRREPSGGWSWTLLSTTKNI